MNQQNWRVCDENEFQNLLGSPVKDYEQLTRLGAGAYLFNEFRGIFKANGIRS